MKIIQTSINKPPRVVIYGPHGVGKSRFGAGCPAPIFIQTEAGLDSLGVEAFELATHIKDVTNALDYLHTTEHPYKTVVIDSLDWTEKLIFKRICDLKGVEDIASIPYGRGYGLAELEWKMILDKLNRINIDKKMMVVLLAHSQIKRFEDPERESYDRYGIDLQTKAAALVAEYADIVGFAAFKVATKTKQEGFSEVTKGRSTGERVLYLEERAAYTAKNRYGFPNSLDLDWKALAEELKKAKKAQGERPRGNLSKVVEEKVEADLEKISTGVN